MSVLTPSTGDVSDVTEGLRMLAAPPGVSGLVVRVSDS